MDWLVLKIMGGVLSVWFAGAALIGWMMDIGFHGYVAGIGLMPVAYLILLYILFLFEKGPMPGDPIEAWE